jgi:hypothetical protein
MKLDYYAEKVGDYGNITGDGLGNLLGAPEFEPLELLIREAVQNSWDARLGHSDVTFGIDYRELSESEDSFLKRSILHQQPPELEMPAATDQMTALTIWDRNTTGLSGPVRPTISTDGPRKFVNFVYMIGEPKQQADNSEETPGGSYGYGRSSFFRASQPRTVLIHSRVETPDGPESRFIAIAWIDKYTDTDGTRYTGRHWWGRQHEGWVGPVLGDEADDVADRLGMPVPDKDETGTTIMMLEPALSSVEAYGDEGDREDSQISPKEQVISSILWNCWPRMLAGGIDFKVRWNGESVPVPDPREHARLKHFARAFDTLSGDIESSHMSRMYPIKIFRPKKHLGDMAIARRPFVHPTTSSDPSSPVEPEEPLRHIALMRQTLLVLKYMKPSGVTPRQDEQYAGMFVTDSDVEDVFASAEPPSHNDWVKEQLSDRTERSFVNVALDRIEEKAEEFISPSDDDIRSDYTESVARLADEIGDILPGMEEPASALNERETGKSGGRRGGGNTGGGPQISLDTPEREIQGDWMRLHIPFSLEHEPDSEGTEVSITAKVVTAGKNREKEPPVGSREPTVVKLETESGDIHTPADTDDSEATFSVPDDTDRGSIIVDQPRDCVVDVSSSVDEFE